MERPILSRLRLPFRHPPTIATAGLLHPALAACRRRPGLLKRAGRRKPAVRNGGDDRIRTGDGGFADLCLATWLRRQTPTDRTGQLVGAEEETRTPTPNGHHPLKMACLPIPPPRHERDSPDTASGYPSNRAHAPGIWQERRDSNPRPAVLETAALPAELRSCAAFGIASYRPQRRRSRNGCPGAGGRGMPPEPSTTLARG